MKYHILNGDALAEKFPAKEVSGTVIVIREAFMEGPVSMDFDDQYWKGRAVYIEKQYGPSAIEYAQSFGGELAKMKSITKQDTVYLWFEDDLFCQCNMWFAVNYILKNSQPEFYRVYPPEDPQLWRGFGIVDTKDLVQYFHQAIALSAQDIIHIEALWKAFVESDFKTLEYLGESESQVIRFQKEVIKALLDNIPDESGYGRPQRALEKMMHRGEKEFNQLYSSFSKEEGIYGFGDEQVRQILKKMEASS